MVNIIGIEVDMADANRALRINASCWPLKACWRGVAFEGCYISHVSRLN